MCTCQTDSISMLRHAYIKRTCVTALTPQVCTGAGVGGSRCEDQECCPSKRLRCFWLTMRLLWCMLVPAIGMPQMAN